MYKKLMIFIFVIFCVISCSKDGNKLSYDGIDYNIVNNPKDFVKNFQKNIPSAIKFKINNYKQYMIDIKSECDNQGIDITRVLSPVKVINAETKQLYSMRDIFTVISGRTINPDNEVFLINLITPEIEKDSDTPANLKNYFKYIAGLWWSHQGKDVILSPELKPGSKICDSCNAEVFYGDGYCYGYYTENNLNVSRLWCNACMEKYLDEYKKSGTCFDKDDVRRANSFSKIKN